MVLSLPYQSKRCQLIYDHIEKMLQSLSGELNLEELEALLNNNDVATLNNIDINSRISIKRKLQELSGDAALVNNAKSRRRIKRYIDNIEVSEPTQKQSVLAVNDSFLNENTNNREVENLANSLRMLKNCANIRDVQLAMDAVSIPEKTDDQHSEQYLQYREPLKEALGTILLAEHMTNKVLRRRIKRLIFVLSSKDEQEILVREAKAGSLAAAAVVQPRISNRTKQPNVRDGEAKMVAKSADIKIPVVEQRYEIPASAISVANCLALLKSSTTASDVEKPISEVSLDSTINSGDGVTTELKNEFTRELTIISDKFTLTAKLRRRIKRLLEGIPEMAVSSSAASSTVDARAVNTEAWGQVSKEPQLTSRGGGNNSSVEYSQQHANLPAAKKMKSEKTEVATAAADGSAELNTPYMVVPLEPIIAKVQQITVPQDLEDALANVKPSSGSCDSRRTLKRAIDRLMKNVEFVEKMNSKIKRRVVRVLSMLSPDPDRKSSTQDTAHVAKDAGGKSAKDASGTAKPIKAIPHIVFVGQLDFHATSNDIENFLRTHGVEGDIKIRLRTSTSTGEFLGAAFVELENAREMYKAIALHHKFLLGRAINIEKSCGGRNKDNRTSRIELKRAEQLRKIREPSDRVLGEFDAAGVINVNTLGDSFKDKLYAVPPSALNELLKQYTLIPSDERRVSMLDELVTTRLASSSFGARTLRSASSSKGGDSSRHIPLSLAAADDES